MPTNPKAIVLSTAKAVELVGEAALEVQLHVALGGTQFTPKDARGAALWYAMFREELDDDLDPGRVEWISQGGNDTSAPGSLPELEAAYLAFITSDRSGFTEAMATKVRSLYWRARSANDTMTEVGAAG